MDIYYLLFTVFFFLLHDADSLMFYLPAAEKKCLREEIHKDILVTGDYDVSELPGIETDIKVLDSKGHILYQKEGAEGPGKFAFTTEEYDMFEVCFENRRTEGRNEGQKEVFLEVKHGVEAKNYLDLGKAEKLKPLELELKRLEDLSESIVRDFAYMRSREEEMRDTNESTHSRVLWFSIFSMVCLLCLAVWQVFYLRRYFKAKKLIE